MPWKETSAMEQRSEFIKEWLKKEWSLTKVCEMYNISRKTGYKWVGRFEEDGIKGLAELSRARHTHPNVTSKLMEEKIIAFRQKHRHWGPRKILDCLEKREPEIIWPASSTIGSILKRYGLVRPRRLRQRAPLFKGLQEVVEQPNDVWATDFKGWFMTQNGTRVDPLTITDLASRCLICCEAVKKTNGIEVRAQFEMAFQKHGLPWKIRSDNGAPFASRGLGGLSRLSVWWIRLGILPERIRPGHPEENGSHERMHRTLKQETATPPKASFARQQKSFDAFREEFNEMRPHEALDMETPTQRYRPSDRPYPRRLPEIEYPADFSVRRVRSRGEIKLRGDLTYIGRALIGEWVGIKQVDEAIWAIHFGPFCVASFDSVSRKLTKLKEIKIVKV